MKKLIFLIIPFLFNEVEAQSNIYTSSGSFTVPGTVTTITIELVGAGGNGGNNGTGGGGGGGYAKGVYTVTPNAVLPVIVGVAGGGASTGSTSVGTMIWATGGGNGVSISNPNIGGGGAAGTGVNGTLFNRTGGAGGGGYYTYFGGGGGGAGGSVGNGGVGGNTIAWTGQCQTPGGSGGASGGSPGGAGGKGAGFTDTNCNVTDPSGAGSNYGGGGGGGNGNGGGPGAGAGGFCQIQYGPCIVPGAPTSTNNNNSNLIVCANATTSIFASGTGTVNWFASPTSTSVLGTGSMFPTPSLTTTTTFYAGDYTCGNSAIRTAITVTVNPSPSLTISAPPSICSGQTVNLIGSGASSYTWNGTQPFPQIAVAPLVTTVYTLAGTGQGGCQSSKTVTITVFNAPTVTISPSSLTVCAGSTIALTASGAQSYTWNGNQPFSTGIFTVNFSSTYTVVATGQFTCQSTNTVNVQANSNPVLSVVANNYTICKGASVVLSVNGAVSYSWSMGPTTATVQVINLQSNGIYSVSGVNLQGCLSTATIGIQVELCTGIVQNNSAASNWEIFPNPSTGLLTIEMDEVTHLQIFSVNGSFIKELKTEKGLNSLDISALPKGIYYLKTKGQYSQPKKLILE